MSRGVDFDGDKCRVQVVAKCPFPNLGDKKISARMHLPGGDLWYQVQTVRSMVQMTGRAVRGPDDWATTYILDKQFAVNVYRKSLRLFPRWWRDAVDTRFPTNTLMTTKGA
jgi:Rad3-related DNA helicase